MIYYRNKILFFFTDHFVIANSEDPGEMPQYGSSLFPMYTKG